MDRITKANLQAFRSEQSIPSSMEDWEAFEHFANFCFLTEHYDEEFDIYDVHTGGDDDLTIDGIAILVNGVLVTNIDDAQALLETNRHLEVSFIFVQAKTSSNFSGEQMTSFKDGVVEFFSEAPTWPVSEVIEQRRELMTWLFDHSGKFKSNPSCDLYFVTTGLWVEEGKLPKRVKQMEAELTGTNLFSSIQYLPQGAKQLQDSWRRSKDAVQAEFTFKNKATLPDISGVEESYIGVLPVGEFLKIVSDDEVGIRKHIFVDNVRDYQGDNSVNEEMSESLKTSDGQDRFAVLNNGVTLVARELRNVADKFTVSDYQIVNGCQTSHVIYNNRSTISLETPVPFKLIATNDETVINAIATATNRQTQVTTEDLYALAPFQKSLESYFDSFEGKKKLFYERRSRQYARTVGIEKVRIITKQIEIRAFSAMFLDDAHRAARYYQALGASVGSKIFNEDHKLDAYYVAAYAYYKLEYLFRNGLIPVSYKPARYHLMMAFRYIKSEGAMPALTANKIERYSKVLTTALWNDESAIDGFRSACLAIDAALGEAPLTGDAVKTQQFTDRVLSQVAK
ncbi:AIPR family protein [Brevibacterium sediminis]